MASPWIDNLDDATLEALDAFVGVGRRSAAEVARFLQDRGHAVSRFQAMRWLREMRQELGLAPPQIDSADGAAEPEDVERQTRRIEQLTDHARILGEARMLRDDELLNEEKQAEVIQRFRQLMTALGRSDGWAARSLGIAPNTLSEVLSNKYNGDTEGHIRRIDKWIDSQYAKVKNKPHQGFLRLSTALAIIATARIAIESEKIAVIYGPSGCGKTEAAKYIAAENPGGIYLEITEGNKRFTALLKELARELKLPDVKSTTDETERRVIEVLRGTGRVIVVDEVHTLVTGRQKEEATLNFLRRIQDKTDCPMLWFGTVELNRYLEEGAGIRQGVDQIFGRVVMFLDLATPVLTGETGPGCHTVEDIRKMAAARQVRLTPDGEQWLVDLANTKGMGGLRAVSTIFYFYKRFGDSKPLSEQLGEDLQYSRMGKAASERARSRMSTRLSKVG